MTALGLEHPTAVGSYEGCMPQQAMRQAVVAQPVRGL